MKKLVVLFGFLALLIGCSASFEGNGEKTVSPGSKEQRMEVAKTADDFLVQLDAGAIDATWAQASPHLHKITSETMWTATLRTLRAGVGTFRSRTLKGAGFTDTIDGVPPGDYAAVAFDTEFTAFTVEEKVVLHKDDGRWKVVGYFLSKRIKIGAAAGRDASDDPAVASERVSALPLRRVLYG